MPDPANLFPPALEPAAAGNSAPPGPPAQVAHQPPQAPPGAPVPPAPQVGPQPPRPGVVQRFKDNLDQHLFFWIALLTAGYVFLFIPQIKNIWYQQPPFGADLALQVKYTAFLLFLLFYYLLSLFVVMRRFPSQRFQDWIERLVQTRMQGWQALGRKRFLSPWYWFGVCTWRLPDLTARWLVAWASNTNQPAPGARLLACPLRLCSVGAFDGGVKVISWVLRAGSILLALAVGLAMLFGAQGDSSNWYPLAGVFCRTMGLLGLLIGSWLVIQALTRWWRGDTNPGSISIYQGRLLAWLVVTLLGGEVLWVLAASDRLGVDVSYRLYTIWAVLHLLVLLIMIGLLIDRWHLETPWPIRQVVLVLLPFGIWLFTRAAPVSRDDVLHHLTADQQAIWKMDRDTPPDPNTAETLVKERNRKWFDQFQKRIAAIPDGPVVLVAASGGGSRAAIFTALAYETLAHTPFDPHQPITEATPAVNGTTWADRIALISSVSGGSLATAYHLERLGLPEEDRPTTVAELRNTTPSELAWRLEDLVKQLLQEFPQRQTDQEQEQKRLSGKKEQGSEEQGFVARYLEGYNPKTMSPDEQIEYLLGQQQALEKKLTELRLKRDQLKARCAQLQSDLSGVSGLSRRKWEDWQRNTAAQLDEANRQVDVLSRFLAVVQTYHFIHELRGPAQGSLSDRDRDRCGWVLRDRAFDEMCLDFMAPILRGGLSPTLDRGDALARFWTQRFGWYNSTNLSGYHGPVQCWNYAPHHPLVVFNTTDVARGARLAVGFPALPTDLWGKVYQARDTTGSPPETLNDRDPNYRVSLARAVRMSSNFPFGFRVMELPDPAQASTANLMEPIHLLDGGVVDNTGLDTIYHLFRALEVHADPKNESVYAEQARKILDDLRERGVVILEIDSGAKPREETLTGLLSGQKEPLQALENAAYNNADQVKALYLKETKRILNRNLAALTGGDPEKEAALAPFRERLPVTTLHLPFECNHYQHGQKPQGEDVMTAWALGPGDKAEVVQRFLIELAMWDGRRLDVAADLAAGKKSFEIVREEARKKLLLDEIASLRQAYTQVLQDMKGLKPPTQERIPRWAQEFGKRLAGPRQQYLSLEQKVEQLHDRDLTAAWKGLQGDVEKVEKKLNMLLTARTAAKQEQARLELERSREEALRTLAEVGGKVDTLNRAATRKAELNADLQRVFEPQRKYDQSSQRSKAVFERRLPTQD